MAWGWLTALKRIETKDVLPTAGASSAVAVQAAFGDVFTPPPAPAVLGFPQAPRVVAGEAPTSSDFSRVADAVNGRLRSGIADGSRRVGFLVASIFRNMRNSDSLGLSHPATLEGLEAYQMVDPSTGTWPVSDAGFPEGANVNAPLPGYVFGNAPANLDAEEDRLALPLWINGHPPGSPWEHWSLAQQQRGGADVSGAEDAISSPARSSALSFLSIRYAPTGPHGNSFGHWLPGPEVIDGVPCDDPDASDDFDAPVNYQYRFTAIKVGLSDKVYAGSCQPGPDVSPADKYNLHVWGILDYPLEYVVILNNGTYDVLAKTDYIEGPYTGNPHLRKRDGEMLRRVFNFFVRDFRGTSDEIGIVTPGGPPAGLPLAGWNAAAFDVHRFKSTQYLLAPAKGTLVGDVIDVEYPAWESVASSLPAGTIPPRSNAAGTSRTIATRFLGCGWAVNTSGLVGSATVALKVGGVVHQTLTVTDAATSAMQMLGDNPLPAGSVVSFEVTTGAVFTSGAGSITVEIAELLEMKPQAHDLALVLRLGGIKS